MSLPIVFIHGEPLFPGKKDYSYVETAVQQAQVHNDNVVLLGAENNAHWSVQHYMQDDYLEGADFTRLPYYEHMSTNPEPFEIAATQMVFILRNWMAAHGHEKAMLCESDTMIYTDMTEYEKRYDDYLAAISIPHNQPGYRWSASCHASFWTMAGIEQMCDIVNWGYGTNAGKGALQLKWDWHRETEARGGICVMTFLYFLAEQVALRNVTEIGEDNLTIDHNVRVAENRLPEEFRVVPAGHPKYRGAMKELRWIDGIPHGWHEKREELIGFAALHFNSAAKALMEDWKTP